MNVLFVNPYISDFTAYDLWLRPLGLYSLAAVVREYTDCRIHFLDVLDRFQPGLPGGGRADGRGKYFRETTPRPDRFAAVPRTYARYGMPPELFVRRLAELPPMDIVFVTTLMTYWLDGAAFTLHHLRRAFPRAHLVLGGVVPTLLGPEWALTLGADEAVCGYGEEVVLTIVARHGGRVADHPSPDQADFLPFPAVEYHHGRLWHPLLTARGCPLRCEYCASSLLNPRFLARSPEGVVREIEQRAASGARHIILFDDALLIDKARRFQPIFSAVAGRFPLAFHTPNGLHTREIDRETALLLRRSGFRTIRLSFESIKPEILRGSSYKVDRRDMEQAVEHLARAGYARGEIEVYLLFGYPGQSAADVDEALRFSRELGVVPRLSFFSPVPGTPVFHSLQARGVLSTPTDPLETNKLYFLYEKSGLSPAEVRELKDTTERIVRANQARVGRD